MRVAIVLISLLALASWPLSANACSCMQPPKPKKALAQSQAVFLGEVTKIITAPGIPTKTVVFRVSLAWKGVEAAEVEVRTASSSAACGYGFEQGETYLVYCFDQEDKDAPLQTNICTRTKHRKGAAKDLKALGKGKEIPKEE